MKSFARSATYMSHALASGVNKTEDLATTTLAAAATVVEEAWHAFPATYQFLTQWIPALGMIRGASGVTLGVTEIVLAFCGDDHLRSQKNVDSDEDNDPHVVAKEEPSPTKLQRLRTGSWQALSGAPALYCGFEAWQGASLNLGPLGHFTSTQTGFLGFAITSSMDCLAQLIATGQACHTKNGKWQFPKSKETRDLIAKGLECAGWWCLTFGNPLGAAICLSLAAMYKLYYDGPELAKTIRSAALHTRYYFGRMFSVSTAPDSESGPNIDKQPTAERRSPSLSPSLTTSG